MAELVARPRGGRPRRWLWVGGIAAACALHGGCGGDDFTEGGTTTGTTTSAATNTCNDNPWICPAGQTCWPVGPDQGFDCFNEGPGALGEGCQLYPSSPTCRAGLLCGAGDVCAPYCDTQDPAHACPSPLVCLPLQITQAGEVHVCHAG